MEEYRRKVGRLSTTDGQKLPFAEYDAGSKLIGGLAKNWIDVVGTAVEPSTRDRYVENIRHLADAFRGLTAGKITLAHVETWVKKRTGCSAGTFNKELEVLRRVLDYGIDHGCLLDNPARKIKRRKGDKKPIMIPARDEFCQLLATMRANFAADSADFAELLATSGCRKSEGGGCKKYGKPPLLWQDINWNKRRHTVTKSKIRRCSSCRTRTASTPSATAARSGWPTARRWCSSFSSSAGQRVGSIWPAKR